MLFASNGALRVLYVGYDLFSACLGRLAELDSIAEVVGVATGRPDESVQAIVEAACQLHVPLFLGAPIGHFNSFVDSLKPDLILVAAYSFRIPEIVTSLYPCINIHPSLLPRGRGPNPIRVHSLDNSDCGLTAHLMTKDFDSGPIIASLPVSCAIGDGYDEISLRLVTSAPDFVESVLRDASSLIPAAQSQHETSTYFGLPSESDLTVRLAELAPAELHDAARREGADHLRFELANGSVMRAGRAVVVDSRIRAAPGTIVGRIKRDVVVALRGGSVRLYGVVVERHQVADSHSGKVGLFE